MVKNIRCHIYVTQVTNVHISITDPQYLRAFYPLKLVTCLKRDWVAKCWRRTCFSHDVHMLGLSNLTSTSVKCQWQLIREDKNKEEAVSSSLLSTSICSSPHSNQNATFDPESVLRRHGNGIRPLLTRNLQLPSLSFSVTELKCRAHWRAITPTSIHNDTLLVDKCAYSNWLQEDFYHLHHVNLHTDAVAPTLQGQLTCQSGRGAWYACSHNQLITTLPSLPHSILIKIQNKSFFDFNYPFHTLEQNKVKNSESFIKVQLIMRNLWDMVNDGLQVSKGVDLKEGMW